MWKRGSKNCMFTLVTRSENLMIGSIYHDYDSQQHKEIIQKVVGNFQNNFSALKQNKCGQIPLKKLIRLHATFFKATSSCLIYYRCMFSFNQLMENILK